MGGGPFALPVPAYRLGIHKRRQLKAHGGDAGEGGNDEERERERERRTASLSPAPESLYSHSQSHSQLPPDAINPRSHSPDTLRQFAVAGLAAEEEVPSASFPLFPHKPLPSSSSSSLGRRRGRTRAADDAAAVDTDAGGADGLPTMMIVKRHSARLEHLGTVTAIMHRCLSEGDVARAKRAFGLLVRTREVDIGANHLWAVGAEILMRDGETDAAATFPTTRGEIKQQQRRLEDQLGGNDNGGGDGAMERDEVGKEEDGDGEGYGNEERRSLQPPPPPPLRWGSAANFDAVRAYFENLIQQHPHDPHRPHLTSALDFWPVLYGIEIYNVDAEFRAALHRLDVAMAANEDEGDEGEEEKFDDGFGYGDPYAEEGDGGYDEAGEDEEEQMEARMRQRQKDRDDEEERRNAPRWAARDELRHETRTAAQRIAARMDETMVIAPYTKHLELLRLRGMLALFIGDLHLPARLIDAVNRTEVGAISSRPTTAAKKLSTSKTSLLPDVTQSLARAARGPEERSALMSRREEQERARGFFARIVENKGVLDGWVKRFVEEEEDDDGSTGDEIG